MFLNKKRKKGIPYFISIGAGVNQLPLIQAAKDLGFQVIGVDSNASAPGFIKCDLKIQESIEDYQEIYTKLLELLIDGKIEGVLTRSYGAAIRTASFLSEKFDIPFIPFERCEDFINKKRMKDILINYDIPTPTVHPLSLKSRLNKLNESQFPIIVKPLEGHAKTDVRFLKTISELSRFLSQNKKNESGFIYERYIPGDEIISVGVIVHKKYHLIDITDKETTFPPYFVDRIHVSPSRYYHLFDKIEAVGQKVSDAFDIVTSPMIMEFIVDPNEELHLIEAVPEFGGEFLSDVVIPSRLGYDVFREMVRAVTGGTADLPPRKKTKDVVVCRYVIGDKGVLSSFNPGGPKKLKGVLFARIFKEIGAEIRKPVTNLDRIGVVIVKGRTAEEALHLSENAEASFNIRIKKK
jgi:biotin carboxylase